MKILTGITLIGVLVIVSGLLLAGMGGVETTVSRGPAIPMAAPSPMQAQPQATPNPVRQVVQSVPAAQAAPTPVLAEATPLPEGQAVTAHAQQQMSGILIFIAAVAIMLALGTLYKISSKTTLTSRQPAVLEA